MTNVKSTLLYMAVLISIALSGQAADDWLVGVPAISDIHHTGEYLSKVAGSDQNKIVNSTDGGIATLPTVPSDKEVYAIGSAGSAPTAEATRQPSDFSGRWSFEMVEDTARSLDLVLYQRGDLVFGRGVLGTSDGSAGSGSSGDRGIESMIDWLNQPPSAKNSASEAAASGTVVGGSMKLDVVSLDSVALYRFDLALAGDLVAGGYTAFGSDGSAWSGNVTGSRID